jgi:uncharacterized membrane protein YgcG
MSARKPVQLLLAALLAVIPAAALFSGAAHAQAQPQPVEAPPPPPPEDEADEQPPPPEAQPPQRAPDQGTFDQQLSPYGRWVDTPEYGRVWVPNAASARADWQPYTDGHWVYTTYGWSFVPDVPWGWAVFHYGRWGWGPALGWYWVPGYVWAPAWVTWRYSHGHVAWAPYGPPGFRYGRRWPGWVAVPREHFTHPISREAIPWAHSGAIVRGARPAESIRTAPEHGHFYGPPRAAVRVGRGGGNRGGHGGGRGGGNGGGHGGGRH